MTSLLSTFSRPGWLKGVFDFAVADPPLSMKAWLSVPDPTYDGFTEA